MIKSDYYFLTRAFLSRRFNVKEVGSYIIIDYGCGKEKKTSVGVMINNNDLFIDIVNNCIRIVNANCKIYPAKLKFHKSTNQIILTRLDRMRETSFLYKEIEDVYKYSWYRDKIIEEAPLKLKEPFLNKKFYARYFNVPVKMLQVGLLKLPKTIALGYRINDNHQDLAINIGEKRLISLPKEKCLFWKAKTEDFVKIGNEYQLDILIPNEDNRNRKPQLTETSIFYKQAAALYEQQWVLYL